MGRENCTVPEQEHPEFLLQKSQSAGTERLRKQTDSFAEDRSFASTSSESLVSTVLYSISPTSYMFFLRMIIIRIFVDWTEFLICGTIPT